LNSPRWRRRAEDRPREICAAALEVFAEKGFAAAKLDEIARRAGVSKGTLYLYFQDKEQMFRAVVRDAVVPNMEAMTAAIKDVDAPFPQVIRAMLSGFAATAQRLPLGRVAKMVIGESTNFPELARVWHDEVASKALGAIATFVEKAQQRGEVRPGDPRLFAVSIMGPIVTGVLWEATLVPAGGASMDLEGLAKQHADAVLDGLLEEPSQ